MANRENGNTDDLLHTDWAATDDELAALLDGVGDLPLDVEEELVIHAFKARLRAEKQRPASDLASPAGNGTSGRAKGRARPGTAQLRLEGLEDRAPSAFPFSLNTLMASAAGAASLGLVADGMPDASPHTSSPLTAPADPDRSAGPRQVLLGWRRDTGVVDHCFSNEFHGATAGRHLTALSHEFLAAVRQSPAAPRHETQPIDHAFAEGSAGRLLPEVGAVLLLGGLRMEPLRGHPHHRTSGRVGAVA
jgi:hypothetical protein